MHNDKLKFCNFYQVPVYGSFLAHGAPFGTPTNQNFRQQLPIMFPAQSQIPPIPLAYQQPIFVHTQSTSFSQRSQQLQDVSILLIYQSSILLKK